MVNNNKNNGIKGRYLLKNSNSKHMEVKIPKYIHVNNRQDFVNRSVCIDVNPPGKLIYKTTGKIHKPLRTRI
jgi:hypothetical protein